MIKIIDFLSALRENNNRDWFYENKLVYREALDNYQDLVNKIIAGISKIDHALIGLEAKNSIFRIYRDIRFSKDKTPYKTHFGAYLANGGRKSLQAGYYFHIEPGNSFIAGGVYMPGKEQLKAIRQEIIFQTEVYVGIIDNCLKKGYARYEQENKMKLAPKGFPADYKYIEELKFKNYVFSKEYNDDKIASPAFHENVIDDFKELFPYVDFLNNAMEYTGNE
ncbi:MAG TPA: DUF2461 domain-containing protein [Bacteroidaceae bacterium]|nr:DUF2461 domain-containing protein [Bacteroidaceae bacterium]